MSRNKHGGAREGAGRPAKYSPEQVAVRLTDEQLAWLDKQAKKNKSNRSEIIRSLIDEKRS